MARQVDQTATYRRWVTLRQIPRAPATRTTTEIWERLVQHGFDVSKRTVERDLLEHSRQFGFTADADGRSNRWSWTGKVFDVPGIEPASALAWVMSHAFMAQHLPAAAIDHLQPYFETAKSVLDSSKPNRLTRWQDKFRVAERGPKKRLPDVNPVVMAVVQDALLSESQLIISHRPRASDELKERKISPLALVLREGLHYLVAVVDGESFAKQFAMHRIERAEGLLASVKTPKDFDLDEFVAESFGYGGGKLIRLVMRLSEYDARHLIECPLSDDQKHVIKEDFIEISATVARSAELSWWLMGYGANVEVLRPASLRKELHKTLQAAVELYEAA